MNPRKFQQLILNNLDISTLNLSLLENENITSYEAWINKNSKMFGVYIYSQDEVFTLTIHIWSKYEKLNICLSERYGDHKELSTNNTYKYNDKNGIQNEINKMINTTINLSKDKTKQAA